MPSLRRHVAPQIKEFRETEPSQRRFRGHMRWNAGGAGGDGAAAGGKVQAPRADGAGRGNADKGRGWEQKKGRWRGRGPATSKMTSFWAATLDASGAAGLMNSGGHCVALPCASAKCSRLLPEVFDDCS